MGNSNWNSSEWDSYKSNNAHKSQAQTFTSRHLHVDLDPKNIIKRESVDSVKNPNSNAIIVAVLTNLIKPDHERIKQVVLI